jgi:hypothetical protein
MSSYKQYKQTINALLDSAATLAVVLYAFVTLSYLILHDAGLASLLTTSLLYIGLFKFSCKCRKEAEQLAKSGHWFPCDVSLFRIIWLSAPQYRNPDLQRQERPPRFAPQN